MTAILNKKILLSLSALAFVSVVVVNATGAFFTDTETSTASTFTAGTLELDINGNGTGSVFDLGLGIVALNPGEDTDDMSIKIKNGGSVDLGWFGYFITTGNAIMLDNVYIKTAKMEFKSNPGADWETADQFITNGIGSGTYPATFNSMATASGKGVVTLNAWNSGPFANHMGAGNGVMMGAVKADGDYEYRFTFELGMIGDADNDAQGKTLGLSYRVTSTQVNETALNALGAADARIVDNAGTLHKAWMDAQMTNQTE